MICCSLQHKTPKEIISILEKVEMAEIRMDLCVLSNEDIEEIFLSDTPLVATCRAQDGDFHETERKLLLAIKAGANFADLEIEAPGSVARRIQRACNEYGTVLIRSFHDFEGTGSLDQLREMVDKCRNMGGEIVKIVTTAGKAEDAARVLSLYKYYSPDGLIAFSMGKAGEDSRLECLAKGSPFTYSSYSSEEATAEGQLPYEAMQEKLRSKAPAKFFRFNPAKPLRLPASKSYAQRAIVAAALAEGKSVLKGYSPCGDSEAALGVATALGAKVSKKQEKDGFETLEIEGNVSQGNVSPGRFEVGESGLLARLMIPLAAQILGAKGALIEGRGTLPGRPMQGADAIMSAFGATVVPANRDTNGQNSVANGQAGKAKGTTNGQNSIANGQAGKAKGTTNGQNSVANGQAGKTNGQNVKAKEQAANAITLPVKVSGPLRGGRAVVDGSKSSQLISGAIMALPFAAKGSTLIVENPTSIPYLYITMEILRRFGIKTRSRMFGGRDMLSDDWQNCDSIEVRIKENQRYKACEMAIEADWSAAAVFMAAGAVFGKVTLEGLDTSSLQADIMMLDLLMNAGASISQEEEPAGRLTIQKAPLRAIEADLSNSPDLFPVTAVLCAFCQGTSKLGGVRRLVHKESDRAQGIMDMLTKLGVKAKIKDDTLQIEGESLAGRILGGRLLRSGSYSSNHDHRMLMALELASLGADGPISIDDVDCVGKSFPTFNDIWKNITL